MGDAATPSRGTVIEALMLALSHSKLQRVVSTDVFRALLNIEYASIVQEQTLELQALWDLLTEEPGFDADAAAAAMCTLFSWQEQFGIEVALPEHLTGLSDRERALRSADCAVPSQEVRRVFSAEPRRARRRTSLAQMSAESGETQAKAARKATWRDRREIGWAAGAVAVLAFLVLGFSMLKECAQAGWNGFDITEFSAGIPLRNAEQIGAQVGAVLSDDGWLRTPEAKRRDQMETALRGLDARKVDVLFVEDSSGRIRAIAQWFDNHQRIHVQFR